MYAENFHYFERQTIKIHQFSDETGVNLNEHLKENLKREAYQIED